MFIAGLLGASLVAAASLQVPLLQQSRYGPDMAVPAGFSLDLKARRLVQLESSSQPIWVTEWDKIQYKAAGINFMDITDTRDLDSYSLRASMVNEFPTPKAQSTVKEVIKSLTTVGMVENLEKLTSFRTRHYRSATGAESQKWLLSRIEDISADARSSMSRTAVTVQEFRHNWGQNSIIARINGTSSSEEVVIIGAHLDSTHILPFLAAPGADDDGSGTVTILEAYRALVTAGFRPNRTVEFHWYAAEEGGLLGSQAVAKFYQDERVKVQAMMQMDMTAWVKNGTREEVGVVVDYTNSALSAFNKKLIDNYLDIPYVETKCGYACSDHASWEKAGYPAAFAIESAFENSNKLIHSGNDRMDISPEFSFSHMLEFSKLATAFAIELGEWSKNDL